MNELTNAEETAKEQALEAEVNDIVDTIKESVPAEKQEELLSAIQKLMTIDAARELRRLTNSMWHLPTQAHSNKSRGIGVTRKNKELSKARRKMAKNSRRINRGEK